MSSLELVQGILPTYLLDTMIVRSGGPAWPYRAIPAIIEACRAAGLVSLGGNLQVPFSPGVWESMNLEVSVYGRELEGFDPAEQVEASAALSLKRFLALGSESALLVEAAAGCTGFTERAGEPHLHLYFSWVVRRAD